MTDDIFDPDDGSEIDLSKTLDDYEPCIVSVLDEDGVEHNFEMIDAIETETDKYLALTPSYDKPEDIIDDDGDLVIFKVEHDDDGSEILVTIDDEKEFEEIVSIFEERLSKIFDFDDDFDSDEFADDDDDSEGSDD